MLFDTSSPGRRRATQITFGFLAVLMLLGLVLFGIGSSNSGGGLADSFNNNGGTTDPVKEAKKQVKKQSQLLVDNPKNIDAALALAKAQVVVAVNDGLDPQTGNILQSNSNAQQEVTNADNAWTRYLALAPTKPDSSTAMQYSAFYSYPGVAKYDKAARALEAALVTRTPTAGLYAQLALDYLISGANDKYQAARAKALSLADSPTRKKGITTELDQYAAKVKKFYADQAAAAKKSSATTPTSTTPKLPTLPSLG